MAYWQQDVWARIAQATTEDDYMYLMSDGTVDKWCRRGRQYAFDIEIQLDIIRRHLGLTRLIRDKPTGRIIGEEYFVYGRGCVEVRCSHWTDHRRGGYADVLVG